MSQQKLTILVAKNASIALVIRTQTNGWYHLIKWNLENNTFSHGAWFKGQLHEDYCDISFDGEYFLYRALRGSGANADENNTITVLSSVPWLKPHWLLPMECKLEGGGYFVNHRDIAMRCSKFINLVPHPQYSDTQGFTIQHAEKYNNRGRNYDQYKRSREDDRLIFNADWSKELRDGSIAWCKDYRLYRLYPHINEDDIAEQLVADFSNLTPTQTPAPY